MQQYLLENSVHLTNHEGKSCVSMFSCVKVKRLNNMTFLLPFFYIQIAGGVVTIGICYGIKSPLSYNTYFKNSTFFLLATKINRLSIV